MYTYVCICERNVNVYYIMQSAIWQLDVIFFPPVFFILCLLPLPHSFFSPRLQQQHVWASLKENE